MDDFIKQLVETNIQTCFLISLHLSLEFQVSTIDQNTVIIYDFIQQLVEINDQNWLNFEIYYGSVKIH